MKAPIPEQANIQLSLFDLNKQIISQLSDYNENDITAAKQKIRELKNNNSSYFMLLSHDIRYYTLFSIDENEKVSFEDEVIACLQDWGTIKDIDWTSSHDSIDCWVRKADDNEIIFFKLFSYDEGVIKCH